MTTQAFAVAVHVLSLFALGAGGSSEQTAGSVGVNPVVRAAVGQLRRAGLLVTRTGVAGAQLARDPQDISLLEVYRAAQPDGRLLRPHPNPNCAVGAHVQASLEGVSADAQAALKHQLAGVRLADLADELRRRAGPALATVPPPR